MFFSIAFSLQQNTNEHHRARFKSRKYTNVVTNTICTELTNHQASTILFFLNCSIGQALVADCLPELGRQKETQLRHAFWGIYISKLSVNIAKPGLMYFYILIDNIGFLS